MATQASQPRKKLSITCPDDNICLLDGLLDGPKPDFNWDSEMQITRADVKGAITGLGRSVKAVFGL